MIRFLLLAGVLLAACNAPQPTAVNNTPVDSSYYVERFGAVGDGETDDSAAFAAAINAAVKRRIDNNFSKGGWGATQATEIRLRGDRTYRLTKPVTVPGNKNITLRSDAMGGATIVYDGPGDYAIVFAAKSVNAAVLVDGINFRNGGVQLQGPIRGRILFQNNQFLHTRGPGISIVDREDQPGETKGFGVVHWVLWNNEFNYCDRGVYVDSKSILLGSIQMNRFRFGVREGIVIDGAGVVIDNNEFQGIEQTDNPYIRLLPKNNYVSQIRVTNNRFGSEASKLDGVQWSSPRCYLLLDDGPNYISNIDVTANMFFTSKAHINTKNSGEEAITIRKKTLDLRIENNDFRHFKQFVINNVQDVREGAFRNNRTDAQSTVFRRRAAGFREQ